MKISNLAIVIAVISGFCFAIPRLHADDKDTQKTDLGKATNAEKNIRRAEPPKVNAGTTQTPQVAGDKGVPKVLLFIRDQGSEQLEYMLVNEVGPMRKILTESGFDVTIASISGKTIKTNSITVTPDCELKQVKIDDYAGFILPCMVNDSAPPESVNFVREIVNKGKPIAAQLGAVNVLGKAGVLNGKKFAFAQEKDFNVGMYPALKGGIYCGSGVVQDGVVITSGTCPWMSKMPGHQDCTAELTRILIGVMTTRTK